MIEELRTPLLLAEALDLGDLVRGGLKQSGDVRGGGLLGFGSEQNVFPLSLESRVDHVALGGHVSADLFGEVEEILEGTGHDVVELGYAGGERPIRHTCNVEFEG